jgi:hypothetical protein
MGTVQGREESTHGLTLLGLRGTLSNALEVHLHQLLLEGSVIARIADACEPDSQSTDQVAAEIRRSELAQRAQESLSSKVDALGASEAGEVVGPVLSLTNREGRGITHGWHFLKSREGE